VSVNGRITPLKKIGGIPRKNWSLISIVLLIGSIPFIKKQKLNNPHT
jgi:hypothetical protein